MRQTFLPAVVLLATAAAGRAQIGPGAAATKPPTVGGIGTAPAGFGPGFSPYLNLNRGGNSAAQNLYGIVRPQLGFQSSIQALQQQAGTAGGTPGPDESRMIPGVVVGTRVRFLNTGGYFLNLAGGTSQSSAGGTGFNFAPTPAGTAGLGSGAAPKGGARGGR